MSMVWWTQNGAYTVNGEMEVQATPQQVYEVLVDFKRAPEIFSNIKASEIIDNEDGKLRLLQVRCRFGEGRERCPGSSVASPDCHCTFRYAHAEVRVEVPTLLRHFQCNDFGVRGARADVADV